MLIHFNPQSEGHVYLLFYLYICVLWAIYHTACWTMHNCTVFILKTTLHYTAVWRILDIVTESIFWCYWPYFTFAKVLFWFSKLCRRQNEWMLCPSWKGIWRFYLTALNGANTRQLFRVNKQKTIKIESHIKSYLIKTQ